MFSPCKSEMLGRNAFLEHIFRLNIIFSLQIGYYKNVIKPETKVYSYRKTHFYRGSLRRYYYVYCLRTIYILKNYFAK